MKTRNTSILFSITFILFCLGAGNALASMYAYIPNTGSNSIAVVDLDDPAIIAEVAVGEGPQGVVVTSDGKYVFVANAISGTISVIQTSLIATAQDEVVNTFNAGGEIGGMAINKDNSVLWAVVNSTNKAIKLDISDPEDIQRTATIDVGDNPQGVAIFNDGETAFVTNADDDTVTVISNDGSSTIDVGDFPSGIVAAAYGDYVYVANEGDGTISVIDGDSMDVAATITVGSGPYAMGLSAWDSYLYVANGGDGTVSLINALTFSVLEEGLIVGSEPLGLAVPKNGSDAYVIDPVDNTLSIVDLEGNVTTLTNSDLNTSNITDLNGPMGLGNFIGGDAPDAPDDVTITNVGAESFKVKWSDNSVNEAGFKLEIKKNSQDDSKYKLYTLIAAEKESYEVTGLNDGVTYNVRLAAYTEGADSEFSSAATATTDEGDDDDDEDEGTDCFITSLFH